MQFSLLTLFGWVTFAALIFWLASLGVLGCVLAVAILKHVLVAWLCMWYMKDKARITSRQGAGQPQRMLHP